jgi:hypothetical protein
MRWSQVVANAGVKGNMGCSIDVEAIELNGQALASRDPFKWAENGGELSGAS